MITVAERARALHRAKQGLKHLHANPATTKSQLGAAREQLNLVYRLTSTHEVWDAVQGIECVVLDVHGAIPTDQRDQGDQSA